MDVYHRVTFNKEDGVDKQVEELGIKYMRSPLFERYIITFEIYESSPNWPEVNRLIQQHRALDLYETVFSNEDILQAQWLRMVPTLEQGYPQPQKAWLRDRPNWENWCYDCGTFRQKSSYFLQKEPSLRKNSFFSLLWTYTFFCKHEVFDILSDHHIHGFEKWDALIYKTKQPSTMVAQLVTTQAAKASLLRVDDLSGTVCTKCGITKYHYHKLGVMYLQQDALNGDFDILHSYEWFGDGHAAHQEMLVSNRFARLALEYQWKGIRFKVVQLV
jgi:hypothetical protein